MLSFAFRHKDREEFRRLYEWLLEVVERNRQSGVDPSTVAYDQGEGRFDRVQAKWAEKRAAKADKLVGDGGRPDVLEAVARMGSTVGGGREIKNLEAHLRADETVSVIAQGTYEDDQGIVVLTDRRLLFLFHGMARQRKEDFPLRSISSVQTKSGMALGELKIFASGNTATISKVARNDLGVLADAVRESIDRRETAPAAAQSAPSPPDPVDQLRKLAELHQAGVLTDAEFAAKKQELLDRM